MTRIVQLLHISNGRAVALVDGPSLRLIDRHYVSAYALAQAALTAGKSLSATIVANVSDAFLPYDEIYDGKSEWRLLPPFDHPDEPARCLVTGTGLTHKASADNRHAMHGPESELTDSMRMYRWGVEGGRPAAGSIGVQPEWFYKGSGAILRACGQPLHVPEFAEDGGEEPEIAGVYVIDPDGQPRRAGLTIANEFSDHRMEKRNYLYLAHSKLRNCAIGPELVIGGNFSDVRGSVSIERNGRVRWSQEIASGEAHMCHSLENLEHHHFKYEEHRRPGDVHIHFFGADAFSFGAGIELQDGDVAVVAFEGFGRPLRNPVRIERGKILPVVVQAL